MFLTLRAVNAPLLKGFSQVSAAGEEMVAAINASLAEVDAAIARTAGSLQALRDGTDGLVAQANKSGRSLAGVGAATDKAAAATPGWQSGLGNVSGSLLKVGAAGALTAGAVVDMAAKFETSTTRLVTSGGEAAAMLQTKQQGILQHAG